MTEFPLGNALWDVLLAMMVITYCSNALWLFHNVLWSFHNALWKYHMLEMHGFDWLIPQRVAKIDNALPQCVLTIMACHIRVPKTLDWTMDTTQCVYRAFDAVYRMQLMMCIRNRWIYVQMLGDSNWMYWPLCMIISCVIGNYTIGYPRNDKLKSKD